MKYPSLSPRQLVGAADGCRTRSSEVHLLETLLEAEAVVEHDLIQLPPLDPGRKVADPVRMAPCPRAEQGPSTKVTRGNRSKANGRTDPRPGPIPGPIWPASGCGSFAGLGPSRMSWQVRQALEHPPDGRPGASRHGLFRTMVRREREILEQAIHIVADQAPKADLKRS
jgi:hypothetical protein